LHTLPAEISASRAAKVSVGYTHWSQVVIPFTPLLLNDQRKVPLSAFGRVRDDTVLIFNSNSPLAEFGMTPFFIFNSNSLVAEFGMTPLCGT